MKHETITQNMKHKCKTSIYRQNILIHPPTPTNTSARFVVSPYPAPPTMPAPKRSCSQFRAPPFSTVSGTATVLVTVRL